MLLNIATRHCSMYPLVLTWSVIYSPISLADMLPVKHQRFSSSKLRKLKTKTLLREYKALSGMSPDEAVTGYTAT